MLYYKILWNIMQYRYFMLEYDLCYMTIICISYVLMTYCIYIIVIHDSMYI